MAVTALVADCEMQGGYCRDESKLERDDNLRTLQPGLGLQPVRHTIVIGASAIFPDVICGERDLIVGGIALDQGFQLPVRRQGFLIFVFMGNSLASHVP